MARLAIIGSELNDTGPGIKWTGRAGVTAISSTIKRSGAYSVQIASLVSATPEWVASQYAAGGTGPWFTRVYIRPDTLPSAENTIIVLNDAPGVATPVIWVTLDNTGVLRLYDEDGVIGSASSALTTGSFENRIELQTNASGGAGACVVRCLLNGTEFAGSSTRSLSVGSNVIVIGGNLRSEAQTQGDWYFDDLAVNNNSGSFQNSYPGAGSIVALRPNAAGDNADFARGGTDSGANWSQTDEIIPNDATDYVSSGTLNHTDDYNVETSPADVGTVNVVAVGVRHSLSSATGSDPLFVTRIKASAGGTVEESATHFVNNTAWYSNSEGTMSANSRLVLYDLPGASTTAWTKADLDAMQIGVRISTGDSDQARVSTLWALVDYMPAGGATLTVQDGQHTHSSETPTLFQAHTLAANDGSHTHQSETPTLAQLHNLVVQDGTHTHSAEAPILAQSYILVVQDGQHSHQSESVVLFQAHTLAVQDGQHSHLSESVVLFQAHTLAVQDGQHSHQAENVVLNTSATLTVQDGQHTHSSETPALFQAHTLAVQDGAHTHLADGAEPTQHHYLVVQDGQHSHLADNVILVALLLIVANGLHSHLADGPIIGQNYILVVQDGVHSHLADEIDMSARQRVRSQLHIIRRRK